MKTWASTLVYYKPNLFTAALRNPADCKGKSDIRRRDYLLAACAIKPEHAVCYTCQQRRTRICERRFEHLAASDENTEKKIHPEYVAIL